MADEFPKAAFDTMVQAAGVVNVAIPKEIFGIDALWIDPDALSRAAGVLEGSVTQSFNTADGALKSAMSQASAHWSGAAAGAFTTWTGDLSKQIEAVVSGPIPMLAKTLRAFDQDLRKTRKKLTAIMLKFGASTLKALLTKGPTWAAVRAEVVAGVTAITKEIAEFERAAKYYTATLASQNSVVSQVKQAVASKAVQVPASVGDPGQWTAK